MNETETQSSFDLRVSKADRAVRTEYYSRLMPMQIEAGKKRETVSFEERQNLFAAAEQAVASGTDKASLEKHREKRKRLYGADSMHMAQSQEGYTRPPVGGAPYDDD